MPLDRALFEATVIVAAFITSGVAPRSPGGGGQVCVDGKLLTAARAA